MFQWQPGTVPACSIIFIFNLLCLAVECGWRKTRSLLLIVALNKFLMGFVVWEYEKSIILKILKDRSVTV